MSCSVSSLQNPLVNNEAPAYGTPEHLVQFLKEQYEDAGYLLDIRILPDGEVAMLIRLMYTHAICMKPDYISVYEKRYCFSDKPLAKAEFDKLQSGDDVPSGWIATRPEPVGFYDVK